MNPASENRKITIVSIGIFVVLALATFVCRASFKPQALEPVKEITVVVNHSDYYNGYDENAEPFRLTFETTAKTLPDAFADRHELLFVYRAEGMEVGVADGEMADFQLGQYWRCYLDGEILEKPLSEHRMEDGDTYYFYLALREEEE